MYHGDHAAYVRSSTLTSPLRRERAGLVASRLGAASVVLTDLPSELPLLRHNAETDASRSGGGRAVAVSACGWGDADAVAALRPPFDVVLCSDVLYQNDETTQIALARTIRDLLRTPDGSGDARDRRPRGRCLMSYHFRETSWRTRRFSRRRRRSSETPRGTPSAERWTTSFGSSNTRRKMRKTGGDETPGKSRE